MSDDTQQFRIDLDTNEAIKKLLELKGKVIEVGDAKNLTGLVSSLVELALPVAAAGAAFLAFKVALDMTIEGEKLMFVEKQFETLTEQAGIATESLREGIDRSRGATVGMGDAMKTANGVIVRLGRAAKDLPEIFELARKTANVMGGEVTDRVEQISQAIATGRQMTLNQLGLRIDLKKAEVEYANSLGRSVETLTEQEKIQARLNAVTEKGGKAYGGIEATSTSTASALTRIFLSFKEVYDLTAKAVAREGTINEMANHLAKVAENGDLLKQLFGDAREKIDALNNAIRMHKEVLALINAEEVETEPKRREYQLRQINYNIQEIENLEKKIQLLKDQNGIDVTVEGPKTKAQYEADKGKAEMELEDERKKNDLILLQESKFNSDLLKIKSISIAAQKELETDAEKFRHLQFEERLVITQQYAAKILEIEKDRTGKYSTDQKAKMINAINEEETAKMSVLKEKQTHEMAKPYENAEKSAHSFYDSVGIRAKRMTKEAEEEYKKQGDQGARTYTTINGAAQAYFTNLGKGGKAAAEAFKSAMLSSLGDQAIAKGNVLFLEGMGDMWEGNPGGAEAAAYGAALLALGGVLKSGGTGGSGGQSSVGGSAPSSGSGSSTQQPTPKENQQKSVNIQFQGHYFETDETRRRMVELVRQESDATDFKYNQVGV